ncbi:holo-ACP synthase [Sulfurospirillum sp. 1612]|uniref:holo-ACP synthase n=1 Tax=Sulfurospirillum sp. 1612 TaxID=3094835 RepID=UPI002F937FC0
MIGIDCVNIDRIKKFQERFGNKALEKFLDHDEIKFAKSIETIAGFWAAKEAISKALGVGISKECGFFDIKLYKNEKNKPSFLLSRRLIQTYAITDVDLSITHDKGFAIAVAIIQSEQQQEKKLAF